MSTEKLSKNHQLNLSMSNRDGIAVNYTAQANCLTNEETQKSYKVDFTNLEINKVKDFKLAYMSKHSNINGFRPGKAPISFIWKQHKDALIHEIINDMVNDAVENIVSTEKLNLITSPKVEVKNSDIEASVDFEVLFTVLPEIKFPDFKKFIWFLTYHKLNNRYQYRYLFLLISVT